MPATLRTPRRATVADLERVPFKAELIDGRIVRLTSSGHQPGRIALRIARTLDEYAEAAGTGFAYGDNTGFRVPMLASGRESFAPDAAYYEGPEPAEPMRFVPAPPTFAVEVRSEGDYGPSAEVEMGLKRADYFAAGTLAVWDVVPIAECIRHYRAGSPDTPVVYGVADTACATPALPGWSVPVRRVLCL